VIEMKCVSPLC